MLFRSENLLKKSFSVFDFLIEEMNDKGKINYFNKWEGFNLPGKVFQDFLSVNLEKTPFEDKIYLFTFHNQKEMALTFFRMQEYYES